MEELLKYFMQETNTQLIEIKSQLDDLQKFKAGMVASARMTSFIVSAICGSVTLACTLALVYYTRIGHP